MTNSFEADDEFWDDVLDRVDQFSRAWESQPPPPLLDDFLPPTGADARAVTLVELIKIDLENRWQNGDSSMSVAGYSEQYPELAEPDGIPVDLLYEELHIRQQYSNTASIAEYARDFPNQATELRRLMNVDHPLESTSARNAQVTIDVEIGETLGDFELLSELGKGAFAKVFLARQQSMQRLVAVKISADRGREPQTLAQLDHPHIVRVYDQRPLEGRDLRMLYMQYLPGGTLQEVLARVKALPHEQWNGQSFLENLDGILERRGVEPPDDSRQRSKLAELSWSDTICLLGQQLAEALHYAHQRGVLHRDIKPANILMSESASPQLVDFNISYCSKLEGSTAAAYFGGSLAYMSPEQLDACNPRTETEAEDLEARSDVYALGILLWEALAGKRPFDDMPPNGNWSATLKELADRRRQGIAATTWHSLPDGVPHAVRTTLEKCLQPDPSKRFSTAADFADQLKLARMPETHELLSPPHTRFQRLVARSPMLAMVLAVAMPNAVASFLNYRLNLKTLTWEHDNAERHYQLCMIAINSIAFPVGIAIGVWLMYRIAREVTRRLQREADKPAPTTLRHRSLRLARYLALLGICEWTIAGISFPIAMQLLGTPLTTLDAWLYPLGLLAAGAWGAALPFFLGTKMLVEVWYPALLRPSAVPNTDVPAFLWLESKMLIYLLFPAGIPLLSFFVFTLRDTTANSWHKIVLSMGGLLLFAVTYLLWQRIQYQLHLLRKSTEAQGADLE